jgi:tetratricopeptide (TPR) repeat protein
MGSGKKLDASGCSRGAKVITLALLLLAQVLTAFPKDRPPIQKRILAVKALYDAKRWDEVVAATQHSPATPGDFGLYRGLALAHLERWDESQKAFQAALARNPRDARLVTELAGLAYRQKQFKEAKSYLRRALNLEPEDDYANNFLASIYLLEGNLEAALKYWNRIGKPRLSDLSFQPEPKVNPILLDRAFQFSRGSVWRSSDFLTTSARLNSLGAFQAQHFDLQENADETFDLDFRSAEKPGWTASPWTWVANLASGLPYQTLYAEFPKLNRKALQWNSSVRWDDQKRRISSEVAGPWNNNPAWHSRIYLDLRNENWNLTSTLLPATPSLAAVNLEKTSAGLEMASVASGRWSWSTGLIFSYRRMRNPLGLPPASAPFFTGGCNLGLQGSVKRALLRYPERRFTMDANARGEAGTFFTQPLSRYSKLEGDLDSRWFPRARTDDYEVRGRLRAGGTFGNVPFDELYVLGFDRDTDLWMRGHPGLLSGQKGNAPLGREYLLANFEVDKVVYSAPFVALRLGPFLDTGKTYDPSGYFGSPEWMWDSGLQLKIRALGSFEFVLGYGKDLRSGKNSFFTTVSH